jgi:uncharacterized protein involved in exopolysaccharide biosynthesis
MGHSDETAVESTAPLRETLRAFWRHKGKMGLFFTGVMIAVALYTFLSARAYRSEAKLFLRLGRENATLDPTATLGESPAVVVPSSRENEINSVIEILKSRPLVENVVDAVGARAVLGREPPREATPREPGSATDSPATPAVADTPPAGDREDAIRTVLAGLEVEAVKRSNIVLITYDGPSPELSRAVVTRLIDCYLDRRPGLNRSPGTYKFLLEQATRLRSALDHSEEELRDLMNATGLGSPEGQRQLLVARIGRLEDDLLQTTTSLAADMAEVRFLREKRAGLSPTGVTAQTKGIPNAAVDALRGQLYTLQLKERELLSIHPEKNSEVLAVRQEMAAAKAILDKEEGAREEITVGPNRVYEEAEIALLREEPVVASLQARVAALKEQLTHERDRLKTMTEDGMRVARLQREVDLQASDYKKCAGSLEQSQIDEALDQEKISNVQVIQPAVCDPKPVRPRVVLNLGAGLAFAVAGAIALAMLAEKLGREPRLGPARGRTSRRPEAVPADVL